VRYSYNGMGYGVRVAETRLEQGRMHLTCVLNYYHPYPDRFINNWDYKTLGSIVATYFIVSYSMVMDLLLISCLVDTFLGRFIRNIPLLSDLAVTSDDKISVGTGIVQ
jgi:hypothetical protein